MVARFNLCYDITVALFENSDKIRGNCNTAKPYKSSFQGKPSITKVDCDKSDKQPVEQNSSSENKDEHHKKYYSTKIQGL